MDGISKLANIIHERDGVSRREAYQQVEDTRKKFYDAINGDDEDYSDPIEVIESELGLEPDYIFDLL